MRYWRGEICRFGDRSDMVLKDSKICGHVPKHMIEEATELYDSYHVQILGTCFTFLATSYWKVISIQQRKKWQIVWIPYQQCSLTGSSSES